MSPIRLVELTAEGRSPDGGSIVANASVTVIDDDYTESYLGDF